MGDGQSPTNFRPAGDAEEANESLLLGLTEYLNTIVPISDCYGVAVECEIDWIGLYVTV